MLELEGVETAYGESQVLFGVSLAVRAGEAVTLRAVGMDIETGSRPTLAPGVTPPVAAGLPHILTFGARDVDRLQIWFNADSANTTRVRVGDCGRPNAGGCQAVVNPTGKTFRYGCWADNAGLAASSNFREVTVGNPENAAVVRPLDDAIRAQYVSNFAEWRQQVSASWRHAGATWTTVTTGEEPAMAIRRVVGASSGGAVAEAK